MTTQDPFSPAFVGPNHRIRYYRLVGTEIEPVPNVIEWAIGYDRVESRILTSDIPGAFVSTVFTGFDRSSFNISRGMLPALFETQVFRVADNGERKGSCYVARACTYEEALRRHQDASCWWLWTKMLCPVETRWQQLQNILAGVWPVLDGWDWEGRLVPRWMLAPMSIEIAGKAAGDTLAQGTRWFRLLTSLDYANAHIEHLSQELRQF